MTCKAPALALLALTILSYLPVTSGGFIWDDDAYVQHNAALQTLPGLWNIWAHTSTEPQYYPLVHTTFWIEYHLWGGDSAIGYHIVNVLLHAASAILLWKLLVRLTIPGAWLAAAIFAIHPIQVESVAWITERKNVLSGFFYLLAFTTYLRAIANEEAINPQKYFAAFALFIAALLSKTVTGTLPAAILLVIWWKRGRVREKDLFPLLPFFIMALVMGTLTGHLEKTQVGAWGPEWSSISSADRLLIAGRAIWFYACKLFFPLNLSFIYPRWQPPTWWIVFPISVAIVVAILWILRNRIGRGPLAAVLFFIGTLFPALGFVNVYPMRYSFVADHFQYLAGIGLIVLFAAAIPKKPIIVAPIIIALGVLTFRRAMIFRDSESLWLDTIAKNPNSWMAHANLGHVYRAQKRYDQAFAEYQQELALAPQLGEPHMDVGYRLATRNQIPQAIAEFRRAIELNPRLTPAYGYLAKALIQQNQLEEAQAVARAGTQIDPNYSENWRQLGRALELSGQLPQAAEAYSKMK